MYQYKKKYVFYTYLRNTVFIFARDMVEALQEWESRDNEELWYRVVEGEKVYDREYIGNYN